MPFGYRFRPGWIKTLVVALLLPVLIGLGFWQLERAAEKTALRDRYAARTRMAPVNVNRNGLDPQRMEFRRAGVRGEYRAALTIFLDNRVRDAVPGYEVLTPLKIQGRRPGEARYILVNRGWVPWGASRQRLPQIETPGGALRASGWLQVPASDYFTLADESGDTTLKRRWQNLDLERYARLSGLALSPMVLQLAPDASGAGGFARHLPEYEDRWIDRHKGYALQWFALALTLLILYLTLNLEKRTPHHD